MLRRAEGLRVDDTRVDLKHKSSVSSGAHQLCSFESCCLCTSFASIPLFPNGAVYTYTLRRPLFMLSTMALPPSVTPI